MLRINPSLAERLPHQAGCCDTEAEPALRAALDRLIDAGGEYKIDHNVSSDHPPGNMTSREEACWDCLSEMLDAYYRAYYAQDELIDAYRRNADHVDPEAVHECLTAAINAGLVLDPWDAGMRALQDVELSDLDALRAEGDPV